jgi:hypothetical protein
MAGLLHSDVTGTVELEGCGKEAWSELDHAIGDLISKAKKG